MGRGSSRMVLGYDVNELPSTLSAWMVSLQLNGLRRRLMELSLWRAALLPWSLPGRDLFLTEPLAPAQSWKTIVRGTIQRNEERNVITSGLGYNSAVKDQFAIQISGSQEISYSISQHLPVFLHEPKGWISHPQQVPEHERKINWSMSVLALRQSEVFIIWGVYSCQARCREQTSLQFNSSYKLWL